MSYILGIDTGGTYTDGVVYDMEKREIVKKTKLLTSYSDLRTCIKECICDLNLDDKESIKSVSLSTTLATNAIVEDTGCEVGLIIIGRQPEGNMPVKNSRTISGGHDVGGNEILPLIMDEIEEAIEFFKDKVGAIAISGYFSVRNPDHEIKVKKLVRQKLNIPVVCAHSLSSSLGYYERTVTAVINAKLVPIIVDLMESIKDVLCEEGINAPLMIVKGDGSLMNVNMAMERPIETILSGPASSIVGSIELSKLKDAVIIDMGGTTSDIAVVRDGIPKINEEGAMIEGWLTRVQAADIKTYGLGGDSRIYLDESGKLVIGPQKSHSFSSVAEDYPYILDELKDCNENILDTCNYKNPEAFMLGRIDETAALSEKEKLVLEILSEGPHTLLYIDEEMKKEYRFYSLNRLIKTGIIKRISATPTDMLHVSGSFRKWNPYAAQLVVEMMSSKLDMTTDEFIDCVEKRISKNVCKSIINTLLLNEKNSLSLQGNNEGRIILEKMLNTSRKSTFDLLPRINCPLVAVGGPARSHLTEIGKVLNTDLVIPDHYEVANAVGSAASKWVEKVPMTIKTDSRAQTVLFTPWERRLFGSLEDAKDYALENARNRLNASSIESGIRKYEILVTDKDISIKSKVKGVKDIHVETCIEVTARGTVF
jgi:N-methylhydantoinase A/oxoprolinase/acetone carboxylase beta subunit